MKLKVKDVNLSTGGPYVAILNEDDARKLDLYALDRIKIKNFAVLVNISTKGIKKGQIGLFEEVLKKLKIKTGDLIQIEPQTKPTSVNYIKKKLKGKRLKEEEIDSIISDIVSNRLSEVEISYFASACYTHDLSLNEVTYLTKAIVKNSNTLNLNKKKILDKHCIGGIPGNRTTMIVVPIVASLGYIIPKTSSRSITSAAGTSDTMETLANVTLTIDKIKKVIQKTNACMVWGGVMELASADDSLIKVERPLSLDPEGILIASILSKKKAVNATHVLIDIPVSENAKIKTLARAKKLRNKFIKVGRRLGMKIRVVFTRGNEPIGNGIGPALEALDVLEVLRGKGPKDLRRKSIALATMLLELAGEKKARRKVLHTLNSGLAYQKMQEIIKAQGKSKYKLKIGKHFKSITAQRSGHLRIIHNSEISRIARIAGSPKDKGAGIYLHVHNHHKVKKGEILLTIYSESKKKLEYALKAYKESNVIEIGP